MLSTIIEDFIQNATQLCQVQDMPLMQPIAFAEQWEEQGGARTIRIRPIKGRGAGPNFYGIDGNGDNQLNQMVRKVWTTLEIQCWGQPDPQGRLLHNTDDTENLRQIVIVAINQAIPGGYHYLSEQWNHKGEAMMYGRCLTMLVEIEQPIADIQPYLAEAIITSIQLTPTENVL